MQVAANGCDRKNWRAGQKMKKRFFFDRVNIDRAWEAIHHRFQYTVDIDSDATLATLAGLNYANFGT